MSKKFKRRSIHANTFEERQENIRRKEEIALKKQKTKERRALNKQTTTNVIENVSTWVKDNPIHPSVVSAPFQEGVGRHTKRYFRTYKAFVRNLPSNVVAQELDDHFRSRDVEVSCIRLMTHRRFNKCLGWGFLEFKSKIEFHKALNLNVSLFKNERILVEGSLRNFKPSKKKPQKIVTFYPNPRLAKSSGSKMEVDEPLMTQDKTEVSELGRSRALPENSPELIELDT